MKPVIYNGATPEGINKKLMHLREELCCLMAHLWNMLSKMRSDAICTHPTLMSQGHSGSVSFPDAGTMNLVTVNLCKTSDSITAKWSLKLRKVQNCHCKCTVHASMTILEHQMNC